MRTLTLTREDFQNPLHPNMFNEILDFFDLPPHADMVELRVSSATADTTEDYDREREADLARAWGG